MALTSNDIQGIQFTGRFRGYDKQEVDKFLDDISADYEEMAKTINDQEKDIKAMKQRLEDFDNMKESLNRSILVAQETADNVKAQAEANSERILKDATQRRDQIMSATQREARHILQTTYDEARKLVNESDELKRGMRSYYQRITMLIEGQLANIKSSEWEETLKPSPVYVGDTEEKLREIIEHTGSTFPAIDEKGEEVEREGETAPETLESFEKALNPQPEAIPVEDESASESTSVEKVSAIETSDDSNSDNTESQVDSSVEEASSEENSSDSTESSETSEASEEGDSSTTVNLEDNINFNSQN